jgi:hypothetical protein
MLEHLRRANAAASSALIHAGAAGLVLMTAIIGWQVFGRFVLGSSPSWAEQAALILMIWYVFFAAAAGVREASTSGSWRSSRQYRRASHGGCACSPIWWSPAAESRWRSGAANWWRGPGRT